MANVVINEQHLTDIAEAIRDKGGNDTYKPREMAEAIRGITGLDQLIENLTFTGDCRYIFYGEQWNPIINACDSRIKTKDINNLYMAFAWNQGLVEVPFEINVVGGSAFNDPFGYVCGGSEYLEKAPVIKATIPVQVKGLTDFFYQCYRLNDDITFDWVDWDYVHSSRAKVNSIFDCCHSLRKVREDVLNKIYNSYNYYTNADNTFRNCYALDEVRGLYPTPYTLTYNEFNQTVYNCYRIKSFVFATDNGTPYIRSWKNQTLDLASYVGYARTNYGMDHIVNYNSGITADKEVTDSESYEALKNDDDWFTENVGFSRYNHDSAVETINSLPNTIDYVTAENATNTIKFATMAGSLTDAGAVDDLTEEEIAVAAAKGWTVSFV